MIKSHRPDETCTLVIIVKSIYEEYHGWEQRGIGIQREKGGQCKFHEGCCH